MLRAAEGVTALNRRIFGLTKWLVYAIAGLMLFEVVSRYSFHNPTSWAPELATLLFGPFFLLGGPYLLHTGGHVAVDILSSRATGRFKSVLAILGALLALLFGAMLLRYSAPLAYQAYEYGETSYSAWNPVVWPAKSVLPLAAVLLILQALAEIVFAMRGRAA
ncbi:TRAP transporter small permease subunit [Rhodobacteraceae bacterium F11138]|nr:TRAP transporter small permease subunit [Rhodobacteraceae bacterium F11138]